MLNLFKTSRNLSTVSRRRFSTQETQKFSQQLEEISKRLNMQEELIQKDQKEIAFLRSELKKCRDNDEITSKKLVDLECRLSILEGVHGERHLYGTEEARNMMEAKIIQYFKSLSPAQKSNLIQKLERE